METSKLSKTDNLHTTIELTNLESFQLDQVLLTDPYYCNATQKEMEYLISFEIDRLLAGFYDTAGISMEGVTRYEGWESLLIGGHTLGHYLTACTNAYTGANSTKEQKEKLLGIITEIIQGLLTCQKAVGTGYIFGATVLDRDNIEAQFDYVEHNETNIFTHAWVPWYTMHKIFEGLISVAQMKAKDARMVAKEALSVASWLGEWTYNRVSSWSEETRTVVVGIEYGGMNDCLYDLYQLTGNKKYAEAAHVFDQIGLFQKVLHGYSGDHILNNYHANTTIPKFAGALNRYISFRKDATIDADIYLEYVKSFWERVVQNHTYITGGNSEWEHFGLDGVLDNERTNCNNETCNAYNMLKLTKKLFLLTGEIKYADYYENTLVNSILSSQNPDSGMTTYFQPMATGYFKVYGERFTKFWCCTGSGMENFTKLGESFYFHKEKLLVVNQYVSSELNYRENGVVLKQITSIPQTNEAEFGLESAQGLETVDITIAFRLPDWLAAAAIIEVDGSRYEYEIADGYAFVNGPLRSGAKIKVILPMEVKAFPLPDNQNVFGFKYGPVVLSALLGTMDMEESTTGVMVTIPLSKLIETSYTAKGDDVITVNTRTVEEFICNMKEHLIRDDDYEGVRFRLINTDANLTFVPHYSQHHERYGIYWYFISQEESFSGDTVLNSFTKPTAESCLDTVQTGYGQYESDELHNLQEYGEGSIGSTLAGTSRYAKANGAFSYRMLVDIIGGTKLLATFKKEDNGKTLRIRVGDMIVYEQQLLSESDKEEYEVVIDLPTKVLADHVEMIRMKEQEKAAVTFVFEGAKGEASARLCNFMYSMKVK